MLNPVSAQLQGTVQKWWWQGIYKPFTLARNPQGSNHFLSREEPFVCRPVSLFKGQCQVQVLWSALLQTHQGTNEEMKVAALIDRDFSVAWDLLPEPCPHVSGSCGSAHASGCAYSMKSTSPCFWCLQLCSVCVVLDFC